MDSENRRFTISVPPDLEAELAAAKKSLYPEATQSAMLRDLIARGVQADRQSGGGL